MEVATIMEEVEAEEVEQDQYLIFACASQEFGIQGMRVQEISAPLGITKIPGTPAHLEGIGNLRGLLVSVIDFRTKFGFPPKARDEDTRIVLAEYEGHPIGITVDSVEEVIRIPDEKVQKLPEGIEASVSRELITGVGLLDDRMIILLNVDKVLTKSDLIEPEAVRRAVEQAQAAAKPEGTEAGVIPGLPVRNVSPADTAVLGQPNREACLRV